MTRLPVRFAAPLIVFLSAVLFFPLLTAGYSHGQTMNPADGSQRMGPQTEDPVTAKAEHDMAKRRNAEREQEIKRDSEKLLELATELKQYVDKTNENIISLDVIRKAEQIEKLAKSVKEKMKAQ